MLRSLVIAAVLLGTLATAWADVYRWVDAQGRAQYSDRWVPGSELVKVDKNRPSPEAAVARQSAEQGKLTASNASIADQKTQAANAQAVKQDMAQARAEQCKKDTDLYEKAIQSRRLYKENKDGTREYASDADADAYRLQLRNAKQASCDVGAK